MKAVVQRVTKAQVLVDGRVEGGIGSGLAVLVAVEKGDGEDDVRIMADRILRLRCFGDDMGRMNLSLLDIGGEILVISQFTLAASLKKGRRPSFDGAERPEAADRLYHRLVETLRQRAARVATGVFGAMMDVHLVNNGPVTFILETRS